ncbi:MAG: 50S ribosomal protein L23 [Betaproteobacteria bacterium]|nr:50S ribosomal protein L23 [Betaproteobacteria bacterium]
MNVATQERLMTVILRPVISEKATMVADKRKQVLFEVLQDATKPEIKAAVELLFKDQKVEVESVNIVNQKGKAKRHGRYEGRRNNVKKAYVCLKGEGDINFVEGA